MIKFFWYLGILPGMRKTDIFISSVVSPSNFYIWNIKLKKELIPVGTFMENIFGMINGLLKLSSTLREPNLAIIFTFEPA
jgi:hypothetical protein